MKWSKLTRQTICFTFGLLFWLAISSSLMYAQENPAETQIVVKLNLATGVTIDAINATYNTTTIDVVLSSRGIYLLQVPLGGSIGAIVEQMKLDLRLLYAEPNFVGEAPEGDGRSSWAWGGENPAPSTDQYATKLLRLGAVRQISRGARTIVAVLDTGLQLDHPALAPRLTTARYDFVDDDANPTDVKDGSDDDGDGLADEAWGHGTHVAGIVALVAPAARLMPLRVLDADGTGDIFTLAEAIVYAVQRKATVINLSLGMPTESALLKDIVRSATLKGVVVVAAAGNLNSDAKQFPAAGSCALAITSIGATRVKSSFSNYGSWISVSAPGESIYSAFPPNGYAWWDGTSMATPFVAGQAALIRSLNSTLTVRQIADLIAGTAQSLDGANPQFRGKLGAGLINILASLQRLQTGDLPKGGGTISGSCSELAAGEVLADAAVSAVEAAVVEEEVDAAALFNAIDDAEPQVVDVTNSLSDGGMVWQIFLPLMRH